MAGSAGGYYAPYTAGMQYSGSGLYPAAVVDTAPQMYISQPMGGYPGYYGGGGGGVHYGMSYPGATGPPPQATPASSHAPKSIVYSAEPASAAVEPAAGVAVAPSPKAPGDKPASSSAAESAASASDAAPAEPAGSAASKPVASQPRLTAQQLAGIRRPASAAAGAAVKVLNRGATTAAAQEPAEPKASADQPHTSEQQTAASNGTELSAAPEAAAEAGKPAGG